METGFLNLYDEEHFSTLQSPYYQRDGLDDNCVLELGDDFTYEVCNFEDSTNFWENQQELNCDLVDLPLTIPIDECFPKSDSNKHEDFQKMLLEWKEHFGSMQASDSEDEVGMTVVSDQLPDKIFEDEAFEYKTKKNKEGSIVAPKLSTSYCWNVTDLKVEPLLEETFSQSINEYQETKSINIKEEPVCDEIKPHVNIIPEFKFEKNESVFKDEVITNVAHTVLKVNDSNCTLDVVEGDLFTDLKIEIDEDCIDVETISDQIPVLEAGDLKSLLEQFEASEAFNSTSNGCSQAAPSSLQLPLISHQTIKDSLPKEVIERIKASARKKVIPLIPAMPTKRLGRVGTRMQDAAAALNRNKLLKIVSGGESIQLDHDYCSSVMSELPKPFYNSDASEYVTPMSDKQKNQSVDEGITKDQLVSHSTEYYVVLASQGADAWDKNSRKDSGLESGDVSDASEETLGSLSVTSNDSVLNKHSARPVFRESVLTTPLRNVAVKVKEPTMVSVLKKCNVASVLVSNVNKVDVPCADVSIQEKNPVQGPKKRKLNLEEYRSRLKDRAKNLTNQNHLSDGKEVTDSVSCIEVTQTQPSRPEMHSVEVQADIEKDIAEQDNRSGLNRDRRQRQYRSRRTSSSSSSSRSSSSSSSCSSTASASRHRRERARKRRTRKNRRSRSSSSSSVSSRSSRRRNKHSSRRKHKHKHSSKRNNSRGHSASLSRSRSSSSNSSTSSSHSSNSSRSRSRSRSSGTLSQSSSWKSQSSQNYRKCNNYWEWQRSRSPPRGPRNVPALTDREKQRQVEERRVIYVGRIDEGTSKAELRRRFEVFGPIIDISVHFREHGDNYGFVTFAYKVDAYEAVEHGNDDPSLPRYDLCFGGRRAFCKTRYADLDGMATNCDGNSNGYSRRPPIRSRNQNEDSFDLLLQEAQAKLRKRKV